MAGQSGTLAAGIDGAAIGARKVWLAVLVAALGYLVDIYDLILFAVVRVPSLQDLGVPAEQMIEHGTHLLDMQMIGMLAGGLLWGILGDRRGRLSVLFGSIVLYSVANIANGFAQTVDQYAWTRLIAGVGLAGELGAGITLVSELMDKRRRGIATTIVAGVGICGALVAVGISKLVDWRVAYFIGGGMGLGLLLLRIGVVESGMFRRTSATGVSRGNFFALFTNLRRLVRYVCVVLVGVPIWYVVGVLVAFSPEIGKSMGLAVPLNAGNAVAWAYAGLALGDFGSGLLSQVLRSRRQALATFVMLTAATVTFYFTIGGRSALTMYLACFLAGIATGYWAVFVTVAAEQFGTNLRATATTTAPNFVRGSLVLVNAAFVALKGDPSRGGMGPAHAAAVVGAVVIAVALLSIAGLEETYGKDLDFVEQ